MRRWAEAHGARPCRDDRTGRLIIALPGEGGACGVGWDEFEPAFLTGRDVFVYDDAPGHARCFVGSAEDAQAFICGGAAGASAPG